MSKKTRRKAAKQAASVCVCGHPESGHFSTGTMPCIPLSCQCLMFRSKN